MFKEERNTRHSVDKSENFIKSGMTLITDTMSDKYLKSPVQPHQTISDLEKDHAKNGGDYGVGK